MLERIKCVKQRDLASRFASAEFHEPAPVVHDVVFSGRFNAMIGNDWNHVTESFERIARKHDCVCRIRSNVRASAAQIERFQKRFGVSLPHSLERFLETSNGFEIAFIRREFYERYAKPVEVYMLEIFDVDQIIERTTELWANIESNSEAVDAAARRCIEFATLGEPDSRIVFSMDAPQEDGEYAIFQMDVDAYQPWEPYVDDFSKIAIARSFESFLSRAVDHMLTTETGFGYWWRSADPHW